MNPIKYLAAGTLGNQTIPGAFANAVIPEVTEHFDSDSVRYGAESGTPWLWLSIPGSRLVLNPYTQVVCGTPPDTNHFQLNAGFFAGNRANRLEGLLSAGLEGFSETFPKTTWFPSRLEHSLGRGEFPTLEATDFLSDENTIVRIMNFPGNQSAASQTLRGRIHGAASLPSPDTLLVDGGEFFYAVKILRSGDESRTPPPHLPICKLDDSNWASEIPGAGQTSQTVVVSIGFSLPHEGAQTAMDRAKAALSQCAGESLSSRKEEWDRLLAPIPHPRAFGISSEGVPSAAHRLWYYGAWTFLLSQIMPALPENNYPYPSIAEGKPALWAEGDPLAPAQCSWTCFMTSALIREIWPELGWDIYEGVMSRITDDGLLLGECLPSRKAQAAWLLYETTGDRERLLRVYPAIKRYLIWRERNPRWMWGEGTLRHDIPDEKDSSFVVSHLIDVDYAIQIAAALGLEDDVEFWRAMTARELENYRRWFFPADSDPMNFFFADSNSHVFKDRTAQEPTYIVAGLAFRAMPPDLTTRLQNFFRKVFRPEHPMVGFDFLKYGESSFIAYGLLHREMREEAAMFIDRILKVTMRPDGDFGETLEVKEGEVRTGGVIPSLFLALQMIDFTLMREGRMIDSKWIMS